MKKTFYYIVVTIDGMRYFIDHDLDYTDSFEKVYQFPTSGAAEDFIIRHKLTGKEAKVMQYVQ